MRQRGFTVIELLIVIAVLVVGSFVFLSQKASVDATARDTRRKTAINAMYFNLEDVYYEQNGHYPQSIDSKTLRAMDPELFTDPNGNKLGTANSDYRYETTDCDTNGKCKHYTLSSAMEREARFVKQSRR